MNTTGTTRWYRSGYVWLVLSPLIATVIAMIITIIMLQRSGSIQQHDNLGQSLGKIYTGEPADATNPEASDDQDD